MGCFLQKYTEAREPFCLLSDIPGDPGSQLPYQEFQEFSPYPLLHSSYLIGISHFPIQVDLGRSALTSPLLVLLLIDTAPGYSAGLAGSHLSCTEHLLRWVTHGRDFTIFSVILPFPPH